MEMKKLSVEVFTMWSGKSFYLNFQRLRMDGDVSKSMFLSFWWKLTPYLLHYMIFSSTNFEKKDIKFFILYLSKRDLSSKKGCKNCVVWFRLLKRDEKENLEEIFALRVFQSFSNSLSAIFCWLQRFLAKNCR